MRSGVLFLPVLALLTLTFSGAGDEKPTASSVLKDYRKALTGLFPEFDSGRELDHCTYRLLDRSGRELGTLHLEDPNRTERKAGYGGTIEVGVVTDAKGNIAGVVPGRNRETPTYLLRLEKAGFFRRWNGISLGKAAEHRVDAVTRATFSSNAIIAGVRNVAIAASGTDAPASRKLLELPQYTAQLKALFPDCAGLAELSPVRYRILSPNGSELGTLLTESGGDAGRTVGFADTIELALALDPTGKIAGILTGSHQETPAYLEFVKDSDFFRSWNGLTLKEAAFQEVDAVTGATYSSRAIRSGVRNLIRQHLTFQEK